MSNWIDCGCPRIDRVSGNGCIQCNPEKAYFVAKNRPDERDLNLFLDHWLIVRKDGDTVLNGTAEDFEQGLRKLVL